MTKLTLCQVRLQDLQSVIHNSDLGDGISLSYFLISIDDLLILKVIFLYVGHFTAYTIILT